MRQADVPWQWLREDERSRFETEGFLVVRDAIAPAMVGRLIAAIDRQIAAAPGRVHNVADVIGRDDAFFDLIDRPTIVPKIVSLLGPNVALNHSHFNVNPPETSGDDLAYDHGWHRDGGCVHRDMGVHPAPRLALKVGIYLTDLSRQGFGQTWIVPGSHRDEQLGRREQRGELRGCTPSELGAVPLLVSPGTAVIYDGRVVHSVRSPNRSPLTRKAVFLQYAFRWMCLVDAMTVAHLRERCDPIRAQLLGFTSTFRDVGRVPGTGRSGRYYPSEADVPIRARMRAENGE